MQISDEPDEILQRLAKWIKAHRNKYAPKTAISKISEYKKLVKDLIKIGFIRSYKSGEVFFITTRGWAYLAKKYPEILMR